MRIHTAHGELTFLIDTQADVSLIKVNSLLSNTPIDTSTKCTLTGITDDSTKSFGTAFISLCLNNCNFSQKFQVVSRTFPIPTHGILGKDFLWGNGCVIDTLRNELVVRRGNNDFVINMTRDFENEIWVPPRCQYLHKVCLDSDVDVVIHKKVVKSGIFIAGSISNKKNPHVSILNTNGRLVRFNANEIDYSPLSDYLQVNSIGYTTQTQLDENQRISLLSQMLNIENTPTEVRDDLIALTNEFSDIFHLPGDKLTCNNFYEQDIHLTDTLPVHKKNFPIPHCHKKELESQIKDMLKDDIIEPSISPYNSPVFLVPKKSQNGEKKWRLVIDFRELNTKIIPDRYPIPRIDEILDGLGNAIYFSTLDMQSGFHQIKLSKSSRKCTAFSTELGHFQFKRLPFGINICPNSFQRMVNLATSGLQPETCFLYLDDIIVVGKSKKHHLANLRSIFLRLRNKNLKLNPSKCTFFQKETNFLGHKVTENGYLPDDSKISAIKNYPTPTTCNETKRFVAFANFYRRFIKNFSVIAAPLNELSKKYATFKWTEDCDKSFQYLKNALSTPPILTYPDFNKEFILTTDASDLGCGAKLAQVKDGIEMPIAFASKAFKNADLKRPPIEKEMLAIYFGITHFRPYLYGKKFLVKTDHKPLVHLCTMKNPTSKVLRMRFELFDYDFDVQYVPGPENVEADALSRINFKELQDKKVFAVTRSMLRNRTDTNTSHATSTTPQTGSIEQGKPKIYEAFLPNEVKNMPTIKFSFSEIAITFEVRKRRSLLFNGNLIFNETQVKDKLKELLETLEYTAVKNKINEIALRLDDDIFRYVSPIDLKEMGPNVLRQLNLILFYPRRKLNTSEDIQNVLQEFHDHPTAGHPGQQRMLEKLKRHYTWKNMRKDVKNFVNSCEKCKLNKYSTRTIEPFQLTTTPYKPFDLVSIDTIGPLPITTCGNRFILSVQCDFSKYVIYKAIPNKEAKTVASVLVKECILIYGPMKALKSDQGTEYCNEILNGICEILEIEKLNSTAYHPETIGSLERNHRVMNEYFRTSIQSLDDWDEWLPFFAFAFNSHPSSTHKYTPFELIFGRQPNLYSGLGTKVDPLYNYNVYHKEAKYRLEKAFNVTRQLLESSKNKTLENQNKINQISLNIGDKVKLVNNSKENKFKAVYTGPYTVTKLLDSNIEILDEKTNKKQIVHKNRLNFF